MVTCPTNDEVIELAPDAKPGDHYICAGRSWILTLGYGSYALEEAPENGT